MAENKSKSQSGSKSDQKAEQPSASNPSLPPKGSNVPHDGRTATGANVGAPSAPASGKPTKAPQGDSAAVQNQTDPNAGLGAQVIGPTPDPVTVIQLASEALTDIELVLRNVQNNFGVHANTKKLQSALQSARDEAAKLAGLERAKGDAGWVAPGSQFGNPNLPASQTGQTDRQREVAARK